ncbi:MULTISPECIES: GntR family transcriptional regulator [unclassified Chelatococcus]|uniref:GntR family transcriptional regulator n=1 Tax=unclassified Chelatococcus TaxID=2638111 RepID=UPI001BCD0D86|nr:MULTISPECIES: GntR family transcriptional regulator [unclassified Chelatococcus]MBS7699783.1 GntR family transcriptional regulator [Chelatococcus sp. YT9]MBX3558129.1 GntR family transcriptional regulator [Chelatococcus sp.]
MTTGITRRPKDLRQEIAAPLHHQVYVVLRQQIIDGDYPAGKALPSEHKLEDLFNVSRITVRRALDRLAAEGLIVRRHGKGNFAQPVITPPPIDTSLRGMLENLLAMGLKTRVDLVEFDYISASPEIAARLELEPGAIVQRVVRVRRHEDTPFSFLTTHVPEAVGRSYSQVELLERPLLSLFEKAGIKVARADQTITAKLADTRVAPLLDVDIGAALLSIRRLVRDQKGKPVEFLEALYRPDIYEYQMSMTRKGKRSEFLWSDGLPAGQ